MNLYFLVTAIRLERLHRRIHPHRSKIHLLPFGYNQQSIVRDKNIGSAGDTLLSREFFLRMDGLPVLRSEERLRLHPSIRSVKFGNVPIRKNPTRADLGEQEHFERSHLGGW